jgi:hypothetical protein
MKRASLHPAVGPDHEEVTTSSAVAVHPIEEARHLRHLVGETVGEAYGQRRSTNDPLEPLVVMRLKMKGSGRVIADVPEEGDVPALQAGQVIEERGKVIEAGRCDEHVGRYANPGLGEALDRAIPASLVVDGDSHLGCVTSQHIGTSIVEELAVGGDMNRERRLRAETRDESFESRICERFSAAERHLERPSQAFERLNKTTRGARRRSPRVAGSSVRMERPVAG